VKEPLQDGEEGLLSVKEARLYPEEARLYVEEKRRAGEGLGSRYRKHRVIPRYPRRRPRERVLRRGGEIFVVTPVSASIISSSFADARLATHAPSRGEVGRDDARRGLDAGHRPPIRARPNWTASQPHCSAFADPTTALACRAPTLCLAVNTSSQPPRFTRKPVAASYRTTRPEPGSASAKFR
jgi:hypothetical protein